ncbi:hypothetical protein F3J37_22010 [Pantoea sp. Al-1710]|uniref:Uncharacterized protein n=1 Tax=Candidatus Pantoea communis TaxID=2608354 RepID=A0ABX0RUT2_9GAMM|nr:hypothetical protein [Pantoea communis]NIG21351.1 hypothetical protein [Pantoea communis]
MDRRTCSEQLTRRRIARLRQRSLARRPARAHRVHPFWYAVPVALYAFALGCDTEWLFWILALLGPASLCLLEMFRLNLWKKR